MKLTINAHLQLNTQVNKRLSDLRSIRSQCVSRTKSSYGTGENARSEETICQYEAKVVDKKITELENWLFKSSSAIKQANATTLIDLDVDSDALLAPLD